MLMVVTLHSALAYVVHDIPRLVWAVRDTERTTRAFDLFCWWSMSVSNPLFFLLAGLLAATMWDAKGPRGFVANRLRRVAVPFFAAFFFVLPATMYAWSYGWLISRRIAMVEFLRYLFKNPELHAEQYGPAHLWFLEYLLLMLGLFAVARASGRLPSRVWPALESAIGRAIRAGGFYWLLPLVSASLLGLHHRLWGIDAALDRHNSFLPDPMRFLYFFAFFLVGVALHRQPLALAGFERGAIGRLVLSVPVFLARAWMIERDLEHDLGPSGEWMLAALGGLVPWLSISGLLGLAPRVVRGPSASVRYLADASFWVYLVHFPIVGLIQGDLFFVPIPAAAKFAIVWVVTMALGLASYQVLVRSTLFGWLLTGAAPVPAAGGVAGGARRPLFSRLAWRSGRSRPQQRVH